MDGTELATHPIHLGLGAKAVIEPAFAGNFEWYEAYASRHADDGANGWLVSQFSFNEPWATWEMHPNGHEVVLCLAGSIVLHQEHPDGAHTQISLSPGHYAVNAPGVWHTADVTGNATGLFITAGMGTQIRPR